MNSAIIIVVFSSIKLTHGDVPVRNELKPTFPRLLPLPRLVNPESSENTSQHNHHVEGMDKGPERASSKDQGYVVRDSSKAHHETHKLGDDFKEIIKKDYGEHKGRNDDYRNTTNTHKHGGVRAGAKHHSNYKGNARNKNKKVSKGFHEEYRKDEEKSKHGNWKHEHTEGKFVKYKNKRNRGEMKHSGSSHEIEGRNQGEPGDLRNFDKLFTVVWSSNKKPVYSYRIKSKLARSSA